MGRLTPVLIATEAFGRDMRKILSRYQAPEELIREMEQHFTIWKSNIRRFHDETAIATSMRLVNSTQLAQWVGERVVAELIDEVFDKHLPAADLAVANRKLAETNEKARRLDAALHEAAMRNELIMAQNDKQADSQLALAHNMFQEVFQLRTTIAELAALSVDGPLFQQQERLYRDHQQRDQTVVVQQQQQQQQRTRHRASSTKIGSSFASMSEGGGILPSSSMAAVAASTQRPRGPSFVRPEAPGAGGAGGRQSSAGVRRSASDSSSSEHQQPGSSAGCPIAQMDKSITAMENENPLNDLAFATSFAAGHAEFQTSAALAAADDASASSQASQQQQQYHHHHLQQQHRSGGRPFLSPPRQVPNPSSPTRNRIDVERVDYVGPDSGPRVDVRAVLATVVGGDMSINSSALGHNMSSFVEMSPPSLSSQVLSANGAVAAVAAAEQLHQTPRRINPQTGTIGPYAIFDYETFVENFEKTRGAKALGQQLAELQAAFAAYVETSNRDRAGIASSYQFQLAAKDGQVKALKDALLRALGTTPTLAKMVRSFMQRVLRIELDQIRRRMLHLQTAVKVWIDHIMKHTQLMAARFDVFVRFTGNIFQELNNHVAYAVAQRFPLAPGTCSYAPPPSMEPLWHFFVLRGDNDPEEEAKAYWQNHEGSQVIALMQTNMCEALKEIHFALRYAALMKPAPGATFAAAAATSSAAGAGDHTVLTHAEQLEKIIMEQEALRYAMESGSEKQPSTVAGGGGYLSMTTTTTGSLDIAGSGSIATGYNAQLIQQKQKEEQLKQQQMRPHHSPPSSPMSAKSGGGAAAAAAAAGGGRNPSPTNFSSGARPGRASPSRTFRPPTAPALQQDTTMGADNAGTIRPGVAPTQHTVKIIAPSPPPPHSASQPSYSFYGSPPSAPMITTNAGAVANTRIVSNSLDRGSCGPRARTMSRTRPVGGGNNTSNNNNNNEVPLQPRNDPAASNAHAASSGSSSSLSAPVAERRRRSIKSLYAGTSWESLDKHRTDIDVDGNPFLLKQRADFEANLSTGLGAELFFGGGAPGSPPSSSSAAAAAATAVAHSAGPGFANRFSKSRGGGGGGGGAGGGGGGKKRFDDWTVEASVENIKFLRGLSKRCTQLSVRSIMQRVHLRSRRQMLLKKMSAKERNAYLTIAAIDREVAHLSDVIDGCRGNGYLAKFRALETEHIIQAWRSTGRRGKPVVTGDSDEDDPRVVPPHAPGCVPLRNLDKIRGDKQSEKSKESINRFRQTLGQTGGTSLSPDDNSRDDGTLGDPVRLVHEMITTGTLWSQSSLGKEGLGGAKGAYRARQDVLHELIEMETQRMNSHEGFKTRRKRRFLRMLHYLRDKIGYAESAIHAARSGAHSTAVEEGKGLLRQFVDEYGIPEQELDEMEALDAARRDVFVSMRTGQLPNHRQQQRNRYSSLFSSSGTLAGSGGAATERFSRDHSGGIGSVHNGGRGEGHEFNDNDPNNNNNRNNASAVLHFGTLYGASGSRLALADDGSGRWRVSRKNHGQINALFGSISETATTNRADLLSMHRLGLTEEQINMLRIQSLRHRSVVPPSDLATYIQTHGGSGALAAIPNASREQVDARAVFDEAIEKIRDDLLFGRNNSDMWFGVNGVLWIPTPGHEDLPIELKLASRDVALRKAMKIMIAMGAMQSLDDEAELEEAAEERERKRIHGDDHGEEKASPRARTVNWEVREASVPRTDRDPAGAAFQSVPLMHPPSIVSTARTDSVPSHVQ